ncbi:hypothetical protein ABH897_005587 [Paenibacillus sp. RC73]
MNNEQNDSVESKLHLPREWADALKTFQEIEDHTPNKGDEEE